MTGVVALDPASLPILNCPFLIFSANSMPRMTTAAAIFSDDGITHEFTATSCCGFGRRDVCFLVFAG